VRPPQHLAGFLVADDFFLFAIPFQRTLKPGGDISQVAHDRRQVAFLDIGDGALAALHAIEEVADVQGLRFIAIAFHLHRLDLRRLFLAPGFGRDSESVAHDVERAFRAVEDQIFVAGAVDFAARPRDDATVEVVERFLHVRRLAAVIDFVASAEARDGPGRFRVQSPTRDVEVVRAPVGHLAAGVVPEPPEVVMATEGIVGDIRRRSQPHIPVEFFRLFFGEYLFGLEAGHRVARVTCADLVDRADGAFPDKFDGLLIMRAGPLLAARLNNAVVIARGFDNLAALDDGQRERLFTINILAQLTGYDRRERVPVVRS